MKTFGWRAVSVALIIVFSDALGEAMIKGNRAKFLSYSSLQTNFTYEMDNQFYEIYMTKIVVPRNCINRANLILVFLRVNVAFLSKRLRRTTRKVEES